MWDAVAWMSLQFVIVLWWLPLNVAFLGANRLPERVFRFCVWLHQEMWIAVPLPLLVFAVVMPGVQGWGDHLGGSLLVLILGVDWWYLRNWPDENKWTRRGRRLKEKVAARGGKLVVEPATA